MEQPIFLTTASVTGYTINKHTFLHLGSLHQTDTFQHPKGQLLIYLLTPWWATPRWLCPEHTPWLTVPNSTFWTPWLITPYLLYTARLHPGWAQQLSSAAWSLIGHVRNQGIPLCWSGQQPTGLHWTAPDARLLSFYSDICVLGPLCHLPSWTPLLKHLVLWELVPVIGVNMMWSQTSGYFLAKWGRQEQKLRYSSTALI